MKNIMHQKLKRIAIIGCGPRGLYALECLLKHLSFLHELPLQSILIFDNSKDLGAGEVWKIDQTDANWINISVQHLSEFRGRDEMVIGDTQISKFPTFKDWALQNNYYNETEILTFPPRSVMGKYLAERFQSLVQSLSHLDIIKIHREKVANVLIREEGGLDITLCNTKIHRVDECLLTIGHQPVSMSDEIKKWQLLANKYNLSFISDPYDEKLIKQLETEDIAIRGMGLAMIDVVRLLALRYGSFKESNDDNTFYKYESDNSFHFIVIPFSTDGLPPVPKPLTTVIDEIYDPGAVVKNLFKENIENLIVHDDYKIFTEKFLSLFTTVVLDLYYEKPNYFKQSKKSREDLEITVLNWLKDMSYEDELILDTKLDCSEYMKETVLMAHNVKPVSLDYMIMQVWRHLQPTMYALFSHSQLPEEVMEKIVELDESSKRYTFGPPVEAIKQLIALSEYGFIDFSFANDPSVEITEEGWSMSKKSSFIKTRVMIDSVLGSPLAKDIDSSIFNNLIKEREIAPVTANLGFRTDVDGTAYKHTDTLNNSLCILGRYCKGSVLGVDAILECFSREAEDWSEGLIKRIN